ncbi:MAG: hypothetical protein P0S96_01600 [Simkaniaceae bacterium]|nr:hypothetical protein [Candidatus Sacchlamyda saccharinae]
MKYIKIFLPLALLAFGCQGSEEEQMNLDEMALGEDEEFPSAHLEGDPIASPQEEPI